MKHFPAFLLAVLIPLQVAAFQSDVETRDQEKNYFLYDELTDSFNKIPKSEAAVDSLLTVGFENLYKNSGLSFRSARQAETIAEEINYESGLAGAFNLLGNNYLEFGDHELASRYYLKSYRLEEKLSNQRGIASTLNNLSLIYLEQEKYETAADYLEESIQAWKSLNEEGNTIVSTNNLGVIHRRQGNYEKALDYFWETANRSIQREEPDSLNYIISTLNIGNTYRNMGDNTRAKIHLNTALEYLERHNLTSQIIFTYIILGSLYNDTQEYNQALTYASKGLELAEGERIREKIKEAHELMASIYANLDNYSEAFKHYKLFHAYSDTLQSMQRSEKIGELQARFDVEQKDREIEILSKEAELREANIVKMNQLRSFLIAGVVVLFIVIAMLVNSNRTRKRNNRNLEEKQRQIEDNNLKLSALNAEKDEFMSIAAHDLRNPLSSINLAVDMINSEENPTRQTVMEYTELIKISSNRMIKLINDVLKIHTIDAENKQDGGSLIDANKLVDEALQHFNEPARTKNIQIKTVLNRTIDAIIGDSDNILRILDNLISNAIKYSQRNTTVIVSTSQKDGMIQISVRDQGPGISKADQKKMFGKFSKLSNKPTGNESSTGLGLFIVKKICSQMNGSVRCESEVGCGATFIVDLPAAKHQPAQRRAAKKHLAAG